MIEVFRSTGSVHTWVVTGHGSLDEIAVTGPTRVLELRDGDVREFQLDPSDHGIAVVAPEDLPGGGPEENAEIARALLAGEERGPARDIVVLNAGAALVVAGVAVDLDAGIAAAEAAIDTGAAQGVLDALRG